ncbi:hypothetical protein VNO77_17157 [Canavalia gladiata]|uniref:Uncharacterized protein n=1 Tax=Canavalia gladiata TaxID=3824 RepID=A0AAN9LJ70_CANGL
MVLLSYSPVPIIPSPDLFITEVNRRYDPMVEALQDSTLSFIFNASLWDGGRVAHQIRLKPGLGTSNM